MLTEVYFSATVSPMTNAEQEMIDRHRRELRAAVLTDELAGLRSFSTKGEAWKVSAQHQQEWTNLRTPAVTVTDDGDSGTILVERRCRDCNELLPPISGRGRPAKTCRKCRGLPVAVS